MKANMGELKDHELIVRIDGGVQETNLLDFEKAALEVVRGLNLDPKTDEEYAIAAQDAKDCKVIEGRLEEIKEEALAEVQDINAVFQAIDNVASEFKKSRLVLEKKVKSEKDRRKKEIIEAAIKRIAQAHYGSKVNHWKIEYSADVRAAAKNKKTTESLKEATEEVVQSWYDKIQAMEESFNANFDLIKEYENTFHGLFHDIYDLALKPENEVRLTVDSRVKEFQLREELKDKNGPSRPDPEVSDPGRIVFPSFPEFPSPPNHEESPLVEFEITIRLKKPKEEIEGFITELKRLGITIIEAHERF